MIGEAIDVVATLVVIGMPIAAILFIALCVREAARTTSPEAYRRLAEKERQEHFDTLNRQVQQRQWTQEWEDERRNKR